jgi:hypothetical protein
MNDEKQKLKMDAICKAIENGWTVKKLKGVNKYQFTKNEYYQVEETPSSRRCISEPLVRK